MKRSLLTLGMITIVSLAMLVAGCTITARPATVHVASAYGGWSPTYYNGNLLYYNNAGRPYYYSSNVMMYVPSSWTNYESTVSLWRTHQGAYSRWHARYHAPRYYRTARRSDARHSKARSGPAHRRGNQAGAGGHRRPAKDKRHNPNQRHKR